jgi:hypothetical protein
MDKTTAQRTVSQTFKAEFDARRYSYLVGAEEECHTAQSRFVPLLQDTSDKPSLARIEEALKARQTASSSLKSGASQYATPSSVRRAGPSKVVVKPRT